MIHQYDDIQLARILKEAAAAGAREALESIVPSKKMSLREVYRYFKLRGHKQCLADRFIENGILQGKRIGTGKNSKIVYSEADIVLALRSKEAANFFIN